MADVHPQTLRWAAAATATYAVAMLLGGKLGWQHLGLVLLIWACLTPNEGARRFIRDWWPMILFWLSYDVMRLFAGSLMERVAVSPPHWLESVLFKSPDGTIWPFYFTRWIAAHGAEPLTRLLLAYCGLIYLSQLFVVPILFVILWARNSKLFQAFLWSFTALHVMTLVIYFAYPAAPPWWIYENGFTRPSVGRSMPFGFEQGSVLSGLFHLSPNRFAAIPSLHGAYPLMLTLVPAIRRTGLAYAGLAAIYTASMWFACVFLNQHYIIDLLIGAGLALLAIPLSRQFRPA